ncbi:LuxR C-terminal-related transcriptional regulator [Nocardiopsis sp. RSe5-2]|uniref:LuxR C-terminal-related transcriptional regulator n=1 Tax=Nocardiopsis endophytica TaxID=3018445 RepID=A0ABT4U538_9ACTN|nr:LuxR C-terminal-related transcriptional regulator [Nocardiopsis endophytica]MDA2812066.1 LuxR C-terminal-related transcriptional regulator [Nocardiopsis endophytica]
MAMAPRTAPARQNLPLESDSFIGRERDLSDLLRLLEADRVVTLCGVGGIGKTRLALRVAAHATGSFADGVWLAEMAGLATAHEVAARVAAAVGVTEEAGRPLEDTLRDALRSRRVLLLLDGCGHVAGPVARLGASLVESCPEVSLLITSEEPVRIPGEAIWRVPPLALPCPDGESDVRGSEAVRLFLERGREARPDLSADPRTVAAAAAVCRAVGGIPLAVELTAAWLRRLSPDEVAAQVTACLRDQTGAAPAPRRGRPRPFASREAVLRALLDHVHGLLCEQERVLLRRLSVFGDWDLESAERVCPGGPVEEGAVLDLVSSLVDRGLIALTAELQERVRYRLPGAVHRYAAELLEASGERDRVLLRHRDHMLAAVEDLGSAAVAGRLMPWAERFGRWRRVSIEYDNVRAALRWTARRGDTEAGLRFCAGLRAYWVTGYHFTEGVQWSGCFLNGPDHHGTDRDGTHADGTPSGAPVPPGRAPDPKGEGGGARARALLCRAELEWARGGTGTARRLAEEGLARCRADDDAATVAMGLNLLALLDLQAGDRAAAEARLSEALALARSAGDLWNEALAMSGQGALAAHRGDLAAADSRYSAALMILRGMDHRWGVGVVLIGQATAAERQGDLAAADRCYRESLDVQRDIGAAPELARCLYGVGRVARALGSAAQAYDYLSEGLVLSQSTGQREGVAVGLASIARVAAGDGDVAEACRLAGAGAALRERTSPGRPVRSWARTAEELGVDAAAMAAWWHEGRRMDPGAAAALALRVAETGRLPRPRTPRREEVPERRDLTARELEVARLVSRGLGNRDIAVKLFIAPATVARHVANINRKLGFHSRRQIAAWVGGPGRTR